MTCFYNTDFGKESLTEGLWRKWRNFFLRKFSSSRFWGLLDPPSHNEIFMFVKKGCRGCTHFWGWVLSQGLRG
jgi:hypothetical protein